MTLGHLLIVDDQPTNLVLLSALFKEDYSVTTIDGGKAALDLLEDNEYDVVLLDIMMPDINGLDVLKIIRQNPDTKELPVILISALAAAQNISTGLKLGANDYIPRPFDVDVVRARVNAQIQLKRLMDERKQLIRELEAANETKNHLLRIAAHDLKNPIQNLGLLHSLLMDIVGGDAEVDEILNVAQDSTTKMMQIVEEFLELEILREDRIKINLGAVDLERCICDVLLQHTDAAAAKGIQIIADEISGMVLADAQRLRQVLDNLISNAVKYSPYDSEIEVFTQTNGHETFIHVCDQGEGIPEEERRVLFEPFSKISTLPTGGESKTGLGLWIVKHMITLQDGDVGMEPLEQGGCNFWVKLPTYSAQSVHNSA